MIFLTRRVSFSMGHRLHNPAFSDEVNRLVYGRCNNPNGHGHEYALEATFAGEIDPETGFCVDLGKVDEALRREIVERFDHRDFDREMLAGRPMISSGENLVRHFWSLLSPCFGGALARLRLEETPKNAFEFRGEGFTPRADGYARGGRRGGPGKHEE